MESQPENQFQQLPSGNFYVSSTGEIALEAPKVEEKPAEQAPPVEQAVTPTATVETPAVNEFEQKFSELNSKVGQYLPLLDKLDENPAELKRLGDLLATDPNTIPEMDLYRNWYFEKHGNIGLDRAKLERAFEDHLFNKFGGIDPSQADFGLEGEKLVDFLTRAQEARSSFIKQQSEAKEAVSQLKSVSKDYAPQNNEPSPEDMAKLAQYYQQQFDSLTLKPEDLGLPQEVSALIDTKELDEFKAKFVGDVSGKPLFGLERYFNQDNTLNLGTLLSDSYKLASYETKLQKAFEQGFNQGAAKKSIEVQQTIAQPGPGHTPGGQPQEDQWLVMPGGSRVPMPPNYKKP